MQEFETLAAAIRVAIGYGYTHAAWYKDSLAFEKLVDTIPVKRHLVRREDGKFQLNEPYIDTLDGVELQPNAIAVVQSLVPRIWYVRIQRLHILERPTGG